MRGRLAQVVKDIKLFKSALKAIGEDSESVPLSSVVSVTPRRFRMPRGLKAFQWVGHVFDPSLGRCFEDIKACLLHFEDVMESNNEPLDPDYLCHVKPLVLG